MTDERVAKPIIATMQDALEMERARVASERVALAEEKLKLMEAERAAEQRTKPSWWSEWTKPGPLLAIAALFGGQFIAYQTDKATMSATISDVRNIAISRAQEQGAALISMATEIHSNAKAADDRAQKYVPLIESLHASTDAQKLINDQVSSRIDAMARAIQDLRASVDTLRDTVQKTHEEMMVDRARREGRFVKPGDKPRPEDDAAAR